MLFSLLITSRFKQFVCYIKDLFKFILKRIIVTVWRQIHLQNIYQYFSKIIFVSENLMCHLSSASIIQSVTIVTSAGTTATTNSNASAVRVTVMVTTSRVN